MSTAFIKNPQSCCVMSPAHAHTHVNLSQPYGIQYQQRGLHLSLYKVPNKPPHHTRSLVQAQHNPEDVASYVRANNTNTRTGWILIYAIRHVQGVDTDLDCASTCDDMWGKPSPDEPLWLRRPERSQSTADFARCSEDLPKTGSRSAKRSWHF